MGKYLAFLFGLVSYVVFFLTFLYSIGFVGNLYVSKSIDSGDQGPVVMSVVVNCLLLTLFAVQHSVMARLSFKRWWTKFVPNTVERSLYVLLTSLILILMYWQWRPLTGVIWEVTNPLGANILLALFFLGWGIVLIGTFLISHFELFGLAQVYRNLQGKEYVFASFRTPFLYGIVRHPIMLGFIIAFWATPRMTVGHLLFAVATTAYILLALHFEEKDLVEIHGEEYETYKRRVSMIVPLPPKS
jgi:protein-S-isoprenylcysteine O-methyltransferase Ste14